MKISVPVELVKVTLFLFKMENEIWKDVPGYEGLYQCSNLGRVKSLPKFISNSHRSYYTVIKILKDTKAHDGYFVVSLYKKNKAIKYKVHQLIAMTFLNHKPNYYSLVVDHIDNNKLNNKSDNLQLISQRENCTKDKKGYSSKYVGVLFDKANKKWKAQILIFGKINYLGYYKEELEANLAYNKKLKEIQND